jgi:hypothetical protein
MKQVFVDLKNFVRFCHISGDITAVQYASICQCINKAAGEIPKPVPEIPKPGKTKAKTTKISMGIGQEAADRCERLRLIFHSECTESQFARIIFHAGLEHYEKKHLAA